MQEQSTMEVDRLSHHPCHRLSVPAAKLFWCRHCMEKFEDPISRWRHSKTCKTEGTLNMNKRKEQEAEAFKLFVESTVEPEQEIEVETSPQPAAAVSPPEKLPNLTQQTGTDLNCFICKKEFTSLNEMRVHVRTPCNKQDKNSEVYSSFPFITESFVTDNHLESTDRLFGSNELDSLLSMHSTSNSQSREEVLITKLLSQWTQQKVSCQQSTKVVKYQSPTPRNSTATSLQQIVKHKPIQSSCVLDCVNEDEDISSKPITATSSPNNLSQEHRNNDENFTRSMESDVLEDFVQQETNSENHEIVEKHWNSQADLKSGVIKEFTNKKRKLTDQKIHSVNKRQRVDALLSNDGTYKNRKGSEQEVNSVTKSREVYSLSNDETCTDLDSSGVAGRWISGEKESDFSGYVDNEAKKTVGLKQLIVKEIKEVNKIESISDISRDNCNMVINVDDSEVVSTGKGAPSITGSLKSSKDQCFSDKNDFTHSIQINGSLERSDKENHRATTDACSRTLVDEKPVPLKMFRPVRTISSVVYPVLNYKYGQDKIMPVDRSPEKEFTVLKTPEIVAGGKRVENNSPAKNACSMRKYKAVKISKNKPKPVRAVIPVLNTGRKNISPDDSDYDSIDNVDGKYRNYPPSPAKTRSKHEDPEFCPVRSTTRTFKPTQKKLELMVEQKSKSKVQPNSKKQSAIKDEITNKKAIKRSSKISEKQAVKKLSVVKETKIADKKPKSSEKSLTLHHELKTKKSKPPKNLKCRLCDRVFDSVKQYQNHTRIPCKMKITRTWSQKVLRPKRSLPTSTKPRPVAVKKKNRDPKKPNIIPSCFRIHSQWEPIKRIRKPAKIKNRPVSPQLGIVLSSKEKRPLPHLQIDVSDLTEKELFLYKFGLMCSDDLPLYMYVKPRVHSMSGHLAVSVDNPISDILSQCHISPPVLERINIDDTVKNTVSNTDLSFNLEPPHLIPAVQCDPVNEDGQLSSDHSLLTKSISESVHNISMKKLKNNLKFNLVRQFAEIVSEAKKSESKFKDHNSSIIGKDTKTLSRFSPSKILSSPRISLSASSVKSEKMETFSRSDSNGSEPSPLIGNEKVSNVDLVVSPRRKEKRNLFETLGWEMLSKKTDLSLSGTKPTSFPQRLADQMDKDILGFLSKGLGIQTSNSTNVVNVNRHDKNSFPSPKSMFQQNLQPDFILHSVTFPPVLQQQSPTRVLPPTSPISPVSERLPASPMSQKLPASPVSQKLPVLPASQKLPVSPASQKLSASPVSQKLPASPVSQELPASPVSQELPASPVSQELPPSPVSQELPDSPVSQRSPSLSHQLASVHRSSLVFIPSPRQSTMTQQGIGSVHQHSTSPKCQIPQNSHNSELSNSLIKSPVRELSKQKSQCSNQEVLPGNSSEIIVSNNSEINISHIVRKLQFNLSQGFKNICNKPHTELVSSDELADEVDGSGDSSSADNILNNGVYVQSDCGESYQNAVQKLHKNESEKSPIEEVLADIVQRICSDSCRQESDVHLTKDQNSCENVEISNGNLKDGSLYSCAQSKPLCSKQSGSSSPCESVLGATVMSCVTTGQTGSAYQVNTQHISEGTEVNKCASDADDVCVLNDVDEMCDERSDEIVAAELEESSERFVDHQTPEVTVEYVDHITSAMLDDSEDVTYIIIEQDDMRKYIDSLKDITNADDEITTNSCVSVS